MAVIKSKSGSPASRFGSTLSFAEITKTKPEKGLVRLLAKKSGRDSNGKVSMRHIGGRHKRFLRLIDWKRDKRDIKGIIIAIEYDPNRTANLALVRYLDGEKRYILAPIGLKVGDEIIAGETAEAKIGNALPLSKTPIGTIIHSLEIFPGKGAQLVRSAGAQAVLSSKENGICQVKFPSGEVRIINENCYATVGQVGNLDWKNVKFGKAGRKRHMGIRPTVRGVAQNPRSHPHGGGEGRSGIGMPSPKSPWGKKTLGKRTRNKDKYSNKMIILRRK